MVVAELYVFFYKDHLQLLTLTNGDPMKCPNDNSDLHKEKYEGVEIDKCSTCGGIWLDAGELETIQETHINDYSEDLKEMSDHINEAYDFAKAKTKALLNCPICDNVLERREYGFCSQILIDSCIKGHGIWLDRHELKALEVFYERSRIETSKIRLGFIGSLLDYLRK